MPDVCSAAGCPSSPSILATALQMDNVCEGVHSPVCGKDGVTYDSKCHLDHSCVDYGHAGECGTRTGSLPNFEFTPKLGMLYLCLAVLAFVTLILDHLALPR